MRNKVNSKMKLLADTTRVNSINVITKKTSSWGKGLPQGTALRRNRNHRVKKAMKADCPGCNCVYL
jgi:hypothetical protein